MILVNLYNLLSKAEWYNNTELFWSWSYSINVYYQKRCGFDSRSWWGVLCDKVCQWNTDESGDEHHKPNHINIRYQ
jgi:hypothetical protein